MIISERTIQCPICDELYKIYADCVGDQSACPACIRKAERGTKAEKIIKITKNYLRGKIQ